MIDLSKLTGEVRVVESVAPVYAELVAATIGDKHDTFSLAVSAGASGAACQAALAGRTDVSLSSVALYYVDERCVPADSPDLNANVIREAFGARYHEFAAVHEMSCDAGAPSYAALLDKAGPLDLVQLGMGPDGHTASLFPGSSALSEHDALVVTNSDPLGANPYERLSLTYKAIDEAQLVVITVMGDKKHAMAQITTGVSLPVSLVRARQVIWLIEEQNVQGSNGSL